MPRGQYAGTAVEVDPEADWTLIVSEGEFLNHHDGPHAVTREHLEQMAAHFDTTSTALLVDYDHKSFYELDTRAAGWSEALRVTDRGLEMQKPDFSARAQEALDDREYRYYSPVYALAGEDKKGQPTGARLLSVALTSLPYFDQHEIDAIGNSATPKTQPDDTSTLFMEREALIEALGLDKDATDEQINAALAAKKAKDEETPEVAASTAVAEPTAEARIAALEAKLADKEKADATAAETERAEALVNSAIAQSKIKPADKDLYLNSAKADYDGTKKRLDAIAEGAESPARVRVNAAKSGTSTPAKTGGFASAAARSYVDKALDGATS